MAIGNVIYTPRKALVPADVVDNLLSTAANLPLSANQGKVLGDAVTQLNTDWFKHQNNVSDLNDATESGIYRIGDGILNSPTDFSLCIVFSSNEYVVQIDKCILPMANDLFVRTHNEIDGWNNWKRVALSYVE